MSVPVPVCLNARPLGLFRPLRAPRFVGALVVACLALIASPPVQAHEAAGRSSTASTAAVARNPVARTAEPGTPPAPPTVCGPEDDTPAAPAQAGDKKGAAKAGEKEPDAAQPAGDKPDDQDGDENDEDEKEGADKPAKDKEEGDPPGAPENPFPKRFKAPDLEGGAGWLNCGGPITLKDLRGKVVLLDFWTFCCINCMHILPDLKFLERKYPKELVVVGVHSAKFDNEKESENIRRAIVRYEIEHPVVNDAEMTIWRKFGVNSWPTLVLIDPEGNYCGYVSGEGQRELLDAVVEKLVTYHRAKGTLDETPVDFSLERNRVPATPLRFPGKLLADAPSQRLFISDSNHNRIVIAGLDGKLQEVIGSGQMGKSDGGYAEASFDHPQGMALVGEKLYIADTENHLLREVDLKAKQVTTLAGTGTQGHERYRGGPGLSLALNSPWDLWPHAGKLFIAMAGPHQIWTYDLEKQTVQPYAGSGREDVTNGALRMAVEGIEEVDPQDLQRISAFAQPSGLASDGESLFVVDSEGSSIRRVPLNDEGQVSTLAGTSDLARGQSLFAFGDRDGVGDEARFQHPLGIAWHAGTLLVADSYNHKIRQLDPQTGAVTTLSLKLPQGEGLPTSLGEPAGVAVANNTLYIADTNHHRVLKVDLETREATELPIAGLAPPARVEAKPVAVEVKAMELDTQTVPPGKLRVELTVELPEGYKLNPELTPSFRVKQTGGPLVSDEIAGARHEVDSAKEGVIALTIPLEAAAKAGELQLTVSFGYCRGGEGGLCKIASRAWKLPVKIDQQAPSQPVKLSAKVE
jgi:thiol-disulfide isomerase/thioredoxin